MSIEVRGITKRFGAFTALDRVSLRVEEGEVAALLGPSGMGKTTLLRIIAGLERPDEGAVLFHGEDASGLRVKDRGVGFVFQHYALFKHMTIAENVAFGLRVLPRGRRPPEEEIRARVRRLLELVQLGVLAGRYPSQLSGGQRQRVALARALAVEPKVLLLDEPFGSLDAKVRLELRRWLRRLHDEIKLTSVFVTHDQDEALELADRVVVMNEGRVEQIGTPEQVYNSPASPFVCRFLGAVNLFRGRMDRGELRVGDLRLPAPEHAQARDRDASVYARPGDIELSRGGGPSIGMGVVRRVHAAGPVVRVEIESGPERPPILVECSKEEQRALALRAGELVYLRLRSLRFFVGDEPRLPS